MITKGNRYIGGGKLFFTENKVGATEVEIGEVQSATLKIGVETKDAFSKDSLGSCGVHRLIFRG